METTFYEDSRVYRGAPTRDEVMRAGTKRPMTLDLNSPRAKKPRATALLTSPDLHMLKLESPELEKLIIQQHQVNQGQCMYPKGGADPYSRDFPDALGGLQQPQHPSFNNLYHHPPSQSDMGGLMPPMVTMVDSYGYPQPPVTCNNNPMVSSSTSCNNNPMVSSLVSSSSCNDNNPMVSSIVTKLSSSCNSNNNPMLSSSTKLSSSSCNSNHPMVSSIDCSYPPDNNGYYSMVSIKEEPQTVPCGPSSPIDMEDQEKLKLERKRLRNRIAASKCRRRKLERIARLEDKVAHLKSENADLQGHVTRLKEHVCHLKQQVLDHVRSGCDILVTNNHPYEEL